LEQNQVSQMALINTYNRGYHSVNDKPKVFDDFLADQLLTEEERKYFDKQLETHLQSVDPAIMAAFPDQAAALAWIMQSGPGLPLILSRARYTEDSLKEAAGQGVKQYVILGAGMDSFAFRCPDLVEKLSVFECDYPSMQEFKRQRLAKLGWEIPQGLQFVPVDFTTDNLAGALKNSSYDLQALSFFSWLGVTYYLSLDEIYTSLRTIAGISPRGSMVIFDYFDPDAFDSNKAAQRVQNLLMLAQQVDEPMKSAIEPSTLSEELAALGMRLHENLNPSDIQKRYFYGRTDGYYATEHAHFAYAVVE